jgi:hypothetical protein
MVLQQQIFTLLFSLPSPEWEEEMAFGVGETPRGGTKKKGTLRGERRIEDMGDGGHEGDSRDDADEEDDSRQDEDQRVKEEVKMEIAMATLSNIDEDQDDEENDDDELKEYEYGAQY